MSKKEAATQETVNSLVITTNEIKSSLKDLTEFLQEHMLTREEAFATFATKDDLKRFATKDDLKLELMSYVTKDDFKSEIRKLRDEMATGFGQLIVMYKKTSEELLAHYHRMNRIEDSLGEVREYCGLPRTAG